MRKPRPEAIAAWIFRHRLFVLLLFASVSSVLLLFALRLRPDAGFEKSIPLSHPYMQTFVQYQAEFGGANRVVVALSVREGDIFTPQLFETLRKVTDEIFFIPGVDRAQVRSLFTPNVRFVEIVEEGFAGGNVVPADFQPTPDGLETVRRNVIKAGEVGRLVANDFSAAIVSAQLQERDPETGKRIDYLAVAAQLEEIRRRHETPEIQVHVIGFAKLIGDVANGAAGVLRFFAITFVITAALALLYTRSWQLAVLPLGCALVAVVWQLGVLSALGLGLDPMSILIPFLIFAVGVSHGVQMVTAAGREIAGGMSAYDSARAAFERLVLPGVVALGSDTVGFLSLFWIDIGIIRELAIAAGVGMAALLFTMVLLLPLLLSCMRFSDRTLQRLARRRAPLALWRHGALLARRGPATIVLATAAGLGLIGSYYAGNVNIGDLRSGAPQLRPTSRYNLDAKLISDRFSIGVDSVSVIAEAPPNACIRHEPMARIDAFEWRMRNTDGVHSTTSLASIARIVNAGWNEGYVKWREIPRNSETLSQSVSGVETASGLLNNDCSVMPVVIFTEDHRAETIQRIVDAAKTHARELGTDEVRFRLATGNVGVMAATNEAVDEAQFLIVVYEYLATIVLVFLSFWSWRGTLYIIAPLGLVSVLAYAVMEWIQVGLTVYTLPVVALGVGVGVDYGIYIFAQLCTHLETGLPLETAYLRTLQETGKPVLFTGAALAIAVSTWTFSELQFQADVGVMLAFMLVGNMVAAIVLIPGLAAWLEPRIARVGRGVASAGDGARPGVEENASPARRIG